MSWMVKMARVSRCGKITAETNGSSVHDDYEHTISRRAYLNRIDVTLAELKICKRHGTTSGFLTISPTFLSRSFISVCPFSYRFQFSGWPSTL